MSDKEVNFEEVVVDKTHKYYVSGNSYGVTVSKVIQDGNYYQSMWLSKKSALKIHDALEDILCEDMSIQDLNYLKQIQEIMQSFDFQRMHNVMHLLEWKWDGVGGVPSVNDLKATAYKFLTSVALSETDNHFMSSGGLRATKGGGRLSLEFVCEWYIVY